MIVLVLVLVLVLLFVTIKHDLSPVIYHFACDSLPALRHVTQLAYPHLYHRLDVQQTSACLQKYLAKPETTAEVIMESDDLVGFFTSVPQERILCVFDSMFMFSNGQ